MPVVICFFFPCRCCSVSAREIAPTPPGPLLIDLCVAVAAPEDVGPWVVVASSSHARGARGMSSVRGRPGGGGGRPVGRLVVVVVVVVC
jgi:hypothetical protein